MSKELTKRIITSLFLIIGVYLMFSYIFLLIILLILISIISWIEFYGLISKILTKKNIKIKLLKLLIKFLSLIYLTLFSFFIFNGITDNNYQLNMLYLMMICVFSDIGGFLFGKIFKGKKLTKISPKKTISGSIGRYSYELNKFIKHKFLFPLNIIINSFFNIFKSYIIFGKIFLPVSYSDTKIFLDKDNNINIVGKKRNEIIQDELKLIDNFFYVNKNVFKKIYKKELPLGSDSHYTSTMSQDSEIEGLKTNNFGELITRKNLFIVDGSIIDKNGSYFPTFQIMHNAYKIAKYIIKKID